MFRSVVVAVLFGLGFCAVAQEKSVRPGINDPFRNPDVKGFQEKFEGESREVYAKRDKIVAGCQLKPGMVVADVGTGTGLFTRLFAKEVGAEGQVFAVDIAPKFLEHVQATSRKAKLKNVTPVLCNPDSVDLPASSVDLAFVCDTYHHFEFPAHAGVATSRYQARWEAGRGGLRPHPREKFGLGAEPRSRRAGYCREGDYSRWIREVRRGEGTVKGELLRRFHEAGWTSARAERQDRHADSGGVWGGGAHPGGDRAAREGEQGRHRRNRHGQGPRATAAGPRARGDSPEYRGGERAEDVGLGGRGRAARRRDECGTGRCSVQGVDWARAPARRPGEEAQGGGGEVPRLRAGPARKGYDPKRVRGDVAVAASAVSAVVNLQARKFAYVPAP